MSYMHGSLSFDNIIWIEIWKCPFHPFPWWIYSKRTTIERFQYSFISATLFKLELTVHFHFEYLMCALCMLCILHWCDCLFRSQQTAFLEWYLFFCFVSPLFLACVCSVPVIEMYFVIKMNFMVSQLVLFASKAQFDRIVVSRFSFMVSHLELHRIPFILVAIGYVFSTFMG